MISLRLITPMTCFGLSLFTTGRMEKSPWIILVRAEKSVSSSVAVTTSREAMSCAVNVFSAFSSKAYWQSDKESIPTNWPEASTTGKLLNLL